MVDQLGRELRVPHAEVRGDAPVAAAGAARAPKSPGGGPRHPLLQAKLVVGATDDPFEREADAMAAHAVRTLGSISAQPRGQSAEQDTDDAGGFGRLRRSSRAFTASATFAVAAGGRIRRATGGGTIARAGGDLAVDTNRPINDSHIQRDLDAAPQVNPLDATKAEFMSRIARLENEVPRLKGQNIAATGEALWAAYSGTISGQQGMSSAEGEVGLKSAGLSNKVPESAPGMRNNRATNPQAYSQEPGPGAAPGESLGKGSYVTNMSESFNLLTTALKGLSQLQFDKYKTFAFWNSPGAKDVAVAAKSSGVLALESSAIGGLFDGFGSYEELASGVESKSWDPQLWAELSRAYASMVIDAIVKDRTKRIVVMCGIGFNDPSFNIWNSIESLTLKLGAKRAKMLESDLQAKTKYFGVAGQLVDGKPVVNMDSTYEGIAGTWVSCNTPAEMVKWQAAQTKAQPPK